MFVIVGGLSGSSQVRSPLLRSGRPPWRPTSIGVVARDSGLARRSKKAEVSYRALRNGDRAACLVLPVDFGDDGGANACRSAGFEHSGAFIERGAGCLDVVDDQHVGSIQCDALVLDKRAVHVFLARRVAQPGLAGTRAHAA